MTTQAQTKTYPYMAENSKLLTFLKKNHLFFALCLGCSLFVAYLLIPDPKQPNLEDIKSEIPPDVKFSYQKDDGTRVFIQQEEKGVATSSSELTHTMAKIDEESIKEKPPTERLSFESETRSMEKKHKTIKSIVKQGDSLFKIFSKLGLPHATLDKIVSNYDDPSSPLKYIYPGQTIHFEVEPESNTLISFSFNKNNLTKVTISRDEQGNFSVTESARTVNIDVAYAQGTIKDAFYLAAKKAQLTDKTILAFADIFAWDIDFTQDIRKGDSFEVVYERNHLEDGSIEPGQILTAHFTNQGRTFSAIAFTSPDGYVNYYTPEGLNVRKAFLRSPVDFARISSRFNLRRRHPVLHTIRAHKGVDYAAKRGTPVKATGDGKVTFKGRKGGYGRVIILQHGQKYSTLYAHLQGYSKKIKTGSQVKQGQVIGYIGSSGLATGPHLHYEFRVNNIHKNPLTVKFPDADPVPTKYRQAFNKTKRDRLSQLEQLKSTTQLAQKQKEP